MKRMFITKYINETRRYDHNLLNQELAQVLLKFSEVIGGYP